MPKEPRAHAPSWSSRENRVALSLVAFCVIALWLTVMAGLVRGYSDTTPGVPNVASTNDTTSTTSEFSGGGAFAEEPAPPPPAVTTTSTGPVLKSAAKYPTDELLHRLAFCETGGTMDPATNTGNGYFGAFQFSPTTWASVGGAGMPHDHSYETQRDFARRLILTVGWSQFPECSYRIGAR